MSELVEKMQSLPRFCCLGAATQEEVDKAESDLQLHFAGDYKEYVLTYGAASFVGHELTGICSSMRLHVVLVTKENRSFIKSIPDNLYIIEETHFDGIVYAQASDASIWRLSMNTKPRKVFNSLWDYISADT